MVTSFLAKEFLLPDHPVPTLDILISLLSERIGQLLDQDVQGLILLLYRLDIAENKVRQILSPGTKDPARDLATLILQRQLEKIKSREKYSTDQDIPEEDRW